MNRQFTVIELLMAVALTLVIGLIVNMAFQNTQLASQRATATLEFHMKARSIFDLLSKDIANSLPGSISPAAGTAEYIAGRTFLPARRSRFMNRSDESSTISKNGFYDSPLIRYGWQFIADSSASSSPLHTSLYRRLSLPTDSENKNSSSFTSDYSSTLTGSTDTSTKELVTVDDVRNFEVRAATGGYSISFSLTNAPYSKKSATNYVVNTDISNKAEAEDQGYIWLNFDQFFPVVLP